MIAEPLARVLEATGYLSNGQPATPNVGGDFDTIAAPLTDRIRLPSFEPDAWWRSDGELKPWRGDADLKVFFKFVEEQAQPGQIADWHREIWNQGFSPLLWVVSPEQTDLYNGFATPSASDKVEPFRTFSNLTDELARLDACAGRLSMETGRFWHEAPNVNRKTSVDGRLLGHIRALERKLIDQKLALPEAQALIGKSIFSQYLVDRNIIANEHLAELCGKSDLPGVFGDPAATARLFGWLHERFNGDMFVQSEAPVLQQEHLDEIAHFLSGTDPESGQTMFFPYRFDVIPVELLSSIYEQFVHSADESARAKGVFYTPTSAVSLILDELFEGLTGHETVLDIACGSGVFLVEALRRLVYLRTDGNPTREAISDALYRQIRGVDIMPEAVRIAAFSLYLAALELDPHPGSFKFQPLIGRTLRVDDAFDVDFGSTRFDVIVGNPPWSFKGRPGTAVRRQRSLGAPQSPRGESLDFLDRTTAFAHDSTRFGMILSGTSFFGRSATGVAAARGLIDRLQPVALVNLADLQDWLFPHANMPAIALIARCPTTRPEEMTLVQARWSMAGSCSHVIEIGPTDVSTLPTASWHRNRALFKASFLGCRYDLLLLDDLWDRCESLQDRLRVLGVSLRTGLTLGNRSLDSAFLHHLPFVRHRIHHFSIPVDLPEFDAARAERPRQRRTYQAPLLLIGEYMQAASPRPVVAVSERDVVFTDSYFGGSFADAPVDVAHLVAAILGSALACWYFTMSASSFGLWIRRLKLADIAAMPMPDLVRAVESGPGKRLVELSRRLHGRGMVTDNDWATLDETVFDLYGLDDDECVVVRDGLVRATWQWKRGRVQSVSPATSEQLRRYAEAFLQGMDAWLSNVRVRAEVVALPSHAPLRVVRFVLDGSVGASSRMVEIVEPEGGLATLLRRIGDRANVPVSGALVGRCDLRVHAEGEVSVIKPAAYRNWLPVHGLEDADAVVQDSMHGVDAT